MFLLTFWISQPGFWGLSAVTASVGIAGKAAVASADERFPVRLQVDLVGRPDPVEDVLDPDDLVELRLRHVDGLALLQLVAVGAVGQVEPVVDTTWAGISKRT